MRFLGYFFLVFATLWILRQIPVLGSIFDVPLLGFFLSAMVVSLVFARVGSLAVDRRKLGSETRRLGAVDTPHNRGKLGSLLLSSHQARKAIPHLEAAVEGEPEVAEWSFRLGQAYLEIGDAEAAVAALERAVSLDEEHAYGGVLLYLARAGRVAGNHQASLEALERFERNNGPSAESAFRRAQALKALGRRDEAGASFSEVGRLASQAPKYQRAEARGWAARAALARFL